MHLMPSQWHWLKTLDYPQLRVLAQLKPDRFVRRIQDWESTVCIRETMVSLSKCESHNMGMKAPCLPIQNPLLPGETGGLYFQTMVGIGPRDVFGSSGRLQCTAVGVAKTPGFKYLSSPFILLTIFTFLDMRDHFVIDPLIGKRQQLLLATQLCRMVLKVYPLCG